MNLPEVAEGYAEAILVGMQQEYPNALRHMMSGPDDVPRPRQVHPAFYGCLDWHSAVEMHWALVRLLRITPSAVPGDAVRALLDAHLTPKSLAVETSYFDAHPSFERPYGWCWILTLAAELASWEDPDARRWSAAVAPLARRIAALYVAWLPKVTYPTRDGAHANSAFALARALPYASAHDPALHAAIVTAARRWFIADVDYPARWEPGGADFLSGALTEAELMTAVLPPEEFAAWFSAFLPTLPPALLVPATVTDPLDGQGAHLHGLNLYRAFAFFRLVGHLDPTDPRVAPMRAAASTHADAALPAVTGSGYMAEHWLAAYAVLLLG